MCASAFRWPDLLHRGLSTAEVIALELEAKDAASTELGRLQLEVGLHQFSRAETQVEAEAGSLPVVYRIIPKALGEDGGGCLLIHSDP